MSETCTVALGAPPSATNLCLLKLKLKRILVAVLVKVVLQIVPVLTEMRETIITPLLKALTEEMTRTITVPTTHVSLQTLLYHTRNGSVASNVYASANASVKVEGIFLLGNDDPTFEYLLDLRIASVVFIFIFFILLKQNIDETQLV